MPSRDPKATPLRATALLAVAVRLALALALAFGALSAAVADPASRPAPYGLDRRIDVKAYLGLPHDPAGELPSLLSQTGVFKDTRHLVPARGLIPYELIVPFWSDGAMKSRWAAIPAGQIQFSASGEWRFPPGTVFMKTFELPTDEAHPAVRRRLETRVLVYDGPGAVRGASYKWRPDESDADLVPASLTEDILIRTATGETRTQTWYYPSPKNCLSCHTPLSGGVLGVKTRQMNRSETYPGGVNDNQLRTWNHLGLFAPRLRDASAGAADLGDADLARLPRLAAMDDATRSIEDRARSYLDANCSQCHRPGGTVAGFDARYDTPLAQQGLIDGPVLIDQGIDRPRIIAPHDIWRSIAFMRVNTAGDIRMPPLGRETIDQRGVALLQQWIDSLPGPPVVSPPRISPLGGSYDAPLDVALSDVDPEADIRYTLDGSVPGRNDMRYVAPIRLTGPTVLRARAYKDGYTRSISAQEVFLIGK
jgi:uncharacterized repeat protein (TIGR03806 family)